MNQFDQDTQKILEVLQQATADALDRKRRLGQYAVIWRDGKPVTIGEDTPTNTSETELEKSPEK